MRSWSCEERHGAPSPVQLPVKGSHGTQACMAWLSCVFCVRRSEALREKDLPGSERACMTYFALRWLLSHLVGHQKSDGRREGM